MLLVPNLFEDNECDPEDPKPRDWDEWNVMEPRAYFKMDGCMFHKGDRHDELTTKIRARAY